MATEYAVRLDREACDGVFACLVRDDRFVEADDGLATIASGAETAEPADRQPATDGVETVRFADDRIDAARSAAAACPLDAIEIADEGQGDDRA